MSPTRRGPPMDIFQDPPALFDFNFGGPVGSQSGPLQPANSNIMLPPSPAQWSSQSPMKRPSPASSPNLHVDSNIFDNVHFAAPSSFYSTDSPAKKSAQPFPVYYAPPPPGHPGHHQMQPQLYQPYPQGPQPVSQENVFPIPAFDGPYDSQPLDDPYPLLHENIAPKRKVSDAGAGARAPKKARQDDSFSEDGPLPLPKDIPIPDDTGKKPPLSYAQLIGLAILRSPDRRLTLSQIYDWIRETYSYYKTAESGWTNSIRHNLSLNKAFQKRERPKDDPGKGNYWIIEAGLERQFLRDRSSRPPPNSDPVPYVPNSSISSDGIRPSTAPAVGHFTLPPKSARPIDVSKFPTDKEKEISSDATVPASDDISPKPILRKKASDMPPPSKKRRHVELPEPETDGEGASPQEAEFNSSPPVVPVSKHSRTKSSPAHFQHMRKPSTSRPKSATASNFRDSGFFSSIESSVPRVSTIGPQQLTSESDCFERPAKVRRTGRAEDEIARLRSESYDPSPSKGRSDNSKRPRHVTFPSADNSSPLRPFDRSTLGLDPFTPGVKFRPHIRAPPTVSPNTNLRLHRESIRELVGTPGHSLAPALPDQLNSSPAFVIHDDGSQFEEQFNSRPTPYTGKASIKKLSKFETFNDPGLFEDVRFDDWVDRGSPIKRSLASAKRPFLQRSVTAMPVLEDITGSRQNIRLGSPIHMPPPKTPKANESPVKNPATPLPKLQAKDFWGTDSSSEEELSAGKAGGIDLLKGFQGIGAGKENEQVHMKADAVKPVVAQKPVRPALGRCSTNLV